MGSRLELALLAAISRGAPLRPAGRRPDPGHVHAALAALVRRRLVRRVGGGFHATARGRALLRAERELALLVARSG